MKPENPGPAKRGSWERFTQPVETIRKVRQLESFRDLPAKKRRERMRVMYRNVNVEER